MRMLLIRHGENGGDPFGCPEQPVTGFLSPAGLSQAQATRDALAHVQIDHALSSPYGRALQTCEMVLAGRDTPIEIVSALKEWQPDRSLDALPKTEFEAIQQQTSGMYAEDTWKTDLGEGCFDMYARIIPPLLKALAAQGLRQRHGGWVADAGAEDRCVAVFAHGGTLNVVLSFILHVQPFPVGCFAFALTGTADIQFTERQGVHYPTLVISALHDEA